MRDDRFHHAAQFLGLGQSCFDDFVPQQRDGHIAQHREAMAAGTVKFP
jgi:hypothetical protein